MIHSRRTAEETKAKEPKSPVQRLSRSSDEERGDLLIYNVRITRRVVANKSNGGSKLLIVA
jgi:hypothetical protein